MREPIIVSGMVLAASPVGEYDKRVVILTRELGKIAAFARGARRMKSPLMAVSNPFVFGEFQVYEGRDSYTLSGANVKEYFLDLARCSPVSTTVSISLSWQNISARKETMKPRC